MPVNFNVVQNKLTVPPSYNCTYVASDVLGNQEVSELINLNNPTIPVATAKSVLEALREISIEQLADGYTIKLDRFVSLVPSIPIRLTLPTDPVAGTDVVPNAKVLKPFKDDVQVIATVNRLGYPVKTPNIVSAFDANSFLVNWARDGYGIVVDGQNLRVDPADADTGIFSLTPGDNEFSMTNLVQNDFARLSFIFEADGSDPADKFEYTLEVRTKYTTGGELRTGVYGQMLRKTNPVVALGNKWILGTNALPNVAEVVTFAGPQTMVKFICRQDPITDKYFASVGPITGDQGPEVEITATGNYVLTGLAADVTVNIDDFLNLQVNVAAYDRYLYDFVQLGIV